MMWMWQLAYDTDDRPKVESVLDAWGLGLRAFVANNPITDFPLGSACTVVAGGRAATIVSLPVPIRSKVSDWHTDFSALPSPDGLHRRLCECTGFRLEPHRESDRRSPQYGAGTVLHRPQFWRRACAHRRRARGARSCGHRAGDKGLCLWLSARRR
jgi:hypothetical protein